MYLAWCFCSVNNVVILRLLQLKSVKWWSSGSAYFVALVVAIVSSVVLLPGLHGGFFLDDMQNIVQNSSLHLVEIKNIDDLLYAAYSFEPGGGTRALVMLSFALDIWCSGLNPVAFKITNIIIHALTSVSLLFFFRRLLQLAGWTPKEVGLSAPILALAWAVHPLQISSVLYIVQRMQTLSTLFVVLSLLSYLHLRRRQIDGKEGRVYGFLVILFSLLAFACKEDAVLIPIYLMVLELTILHFSAQSAVLHKWLRYGFTAFFVGGGVVYFLFVVPHYWHSDSYPGRDFSSAERLMTQSRVLLMYIGQILIPAPSLLPFNYDDLAVSRSLWEPKTTLLAMAVLIGLLGWAWSWRLKSPVFSLGVLLFFSGHFMTSNVIGLELVFEHRNHFPLVGAVLAVAGLVVAGIRVLGSRRWIVLILVGCFFVGEAGAAVVRAHIWGDELRMAKYNLAIAPTSERAWVKLCTTYYRLREKGKDDPNLNLAIKTCRDGADFLPDSAVLMHNVVIYKTVKGSVTDEDWNEFLTRLGRARINVQNKAILWVTLDNVDYGLINNEKYVLKVIDIITSKAKLRPQEYLRVAAYIFNDTHEPIRALPLLKMAVKTSSIDDPEIKKMLGNLQDIGRQDWVDSILGVEEKKEKQND